MLTKTKSGFTGLVASKAQATAARLCKRFNHKKVYEIFGEYCGLTSDILDKGHALSWLYYEYGRLNGFALGRRKHHAFGLHETFVFEEIWANCDGTSTEWGFPSEDDIRRLDQFKRLISSLDEPQIVLRAPVDNNFAHLVARNLDAIWINGLILAERRWKDKVEFSTPPGVKLRVFKNGDQKYMARIHQESFAENISPDQYKAWATKLNCRTIIAIKERCPVGFIIAEKRRCGSLGDFTIAIDHHYRRRGLGSALLCSAFNVFVDMELNKVIADCLLLNSSAHYLYQKHNFKPKRIYNYFVCKNARESSHEKALNT
jgi:ribosomal protein S18 acetylase RimI-like enzyme